MSVIRVEIPRHVLASSNVIQFASIADVFAFAESLCEKAYEARGGPAKDPDQRYEQQLAREQSEAAWFEELYCVIREVADDWNREAIERRAANRPDRMWEESTCDPATAIKEAGERVVSTVKDWDY